MRQVLRLTVTTVLSLTLLVTAWGTADHRDRLTGVSVETGPVPKARCGPDDRPEPGLQGRVSLRDRESGRSQRGYWCNLELLGRFQGEGSSWVSQSYRHCAYLSTKSPSAAAYPGVQVLDVSNPRRPHRVGTLTDPAMLGTWESLKVNTARGLLGAVNASAGEGAAFFAVYDIKTDCAEPRLLSSVSSSDLGLPANLLGHEGDWSPDGLTYWSASLWGGQVTAIDTADPALPRIVFTGQTSPANHGLALSRNGERLYMAKVGMGAGGPLEGNGVQIFDVSDIQDRRPAPQLRLVSEALWQDGAIGQHAINISYGGRPHLVFVDEGGAGAARILDIGDESHPQVISKLKLAIHLPRHADLRAKDTEGTGFFGYEGHYCDVDRLRNPRALACGYIQSGIRVFDIRHPRRPREIAYYNPPAQLGANERLPSSEHAGGPGGNATLSTDWCTSPPRFVGSRQLWVTCQDNGFMTLRFTHGAAPRT